MKILFDLRLLSDGWSGIAVYTVNFLKAISSSHLAKHIILLIKDEETNNNLKQSHIINYESFDKIIFLNKNIFNPISFFYLNKIIKNENIDYYLTTQFFWPYYILKIKVICMIHDIIPLTHQNLMAKSKKSRLSIILKYFTFLSLKMSHAVIVNSDTTLNSLKIIFGEIITKKCLKIYPVVSHNNLIENKNKNLKLNKFDNYILYVGRQDPYKNLNRLIMAFKLLKESNLFFGKLVLAGKRDLRYKQTFEIVKEHKLENDVILLDFVDNEKLEQLYNNCKFVVQPSIVEGFGLTAFEPFLYGKLCIMSKISSFLECFGEDMIYFNPLDIMDIKNSFIKVLSMSEEKIDQYIEKGQLKIKRFNTKNALLMFESIFVRED